MYFPYLRGKQYELIMLRENAALIAKHPIIPIIEPVKNRISGLRRTIEVLQKEAARCAIITNPTVGEFASSPTDLHSFLETVSDQANDLITAFALTASTRPEEIEPYADTSNLMFLHLAQVDDVATVERVEEVGGEFHVFAEEQCGKLYRRKFVDAEAIRVLLKDGFIQRKNADYDEHEHFSDLHATYTEERMDGFGDYLVVGRSYQEGGGPAYVVAIHITYIDDNDDMQVCHFRSADSSTPVNPGGKFLDALENLIKALDNKRFPILETRAIQEFRQLYTKKHYPGLGYIKKLSMQHHLEVMAEFLGR